MQFTQAGRLDHTGQNLLRIGAARGSIAAGDLAIDDGGPQRLFGAPIRGVQREIEEKAEERRQFGAEMSGEPLAGPHASRSIEQVEHARDQVSARHRGAMRGGLARAEPVANVERLLQHSMHLRRPARAWMRLHDLAAPPQQMRDTRLMDRVVKLTVRCPAVTTKMPIELRAEHRRRFGKAAAGLNGIDHRGRGRKRPQPPELAATFQLVSSGLTTGLPRTCSHKAP